MATAIKLFAIVLLLCLVCEAARPQPGPVGVTRKPVPIMPGQSAASKQQVAAPKAGTAALKTGGAAPKKVAAPKAGTAAPKKVAAPKAGASAMPGSTVGSAQAYDQRRWIGK
jgi:hypothetical protein